MSYSFGGGIYFDYPIESLVKRNDFIEVTQKALKSTLRAVKFLYENLLVLSNKLLPYHSQLVFLVPFFNYLGDKELSLGDENLNKVKGLVYPIIQILRKENAGNIAYNIQSNLIIIYETQNKIASTFHFCGN